MVCAACSSVRAGLLRFVRRLSMNSSGETLRAAVMAGQQPAGAD